MRVPRRPSEAEAIRDWVGDLPAGTVFRPVDVPASVGVNTTLSKMAAQPNAPLERIVKGLYTKRRQYDDGTWGAVLFGLQRTIAMRHLGPGAGYGEFSAVNRLGWSTQLPIQDWFVGVALPGRKLPKPPRPSMRYQGRRNERRRRLTFDEVTLLEGIRDFLGSEISWTDAVWRMVTGWTAAKLGEGCLLRPKALRWAALGEPPQIRPMMVEMVANYTAEMPGDITWAPLTPTNSRGEIILPRKPKSFMAARQKEEENREFVLPAMLYDSRPTNKQPSTFKFMEARHRQAKRTQLPPSTTTAAIRHEDLQPLGDHRVASTTP